MRKGLISHRSIIRPDIANHRYRIPATISSRGGCGGPVLRLLSMPTCMWETSLHIVVLPRGRSFVKENIITVRKKEGNI